jgi:hypothetical protein
MTLPNGKASTTSSEADLSQAGSQNSFTVDESLLSNTPGPSTSSSTSSKRRASLTPPVSLSPPFGADGAVGQANGKNHLSKDWDKEEDNISGSDLELDELDDEMASNRPTMHRPDGGTSQQPLLNKTEERGRQSYDSPNGSARPEFAARRSTFRSRSPVYPPEKNATRKKYTYAAFFLSISLVAFVVQTETAVYIQHELGWNKAYCML